MSKTNPDPLNDLIQEALDELVARELAEFASHVETARTMLRKFPEFVTGPEFPKQLRAAFVQQEGREPDDAVDLEEEILEPGHRDRRLPDAIEIANSWMARGRSPKAQKLPDEIDSATSAPSKRAMFASPLAVERSGLRVVSAAHGSKV